MVSRFITIDSEVQTARRRRREAEGKLDALRREGGEISTLLTKEESLYLLNDSPALDEFATGARAAAPGAAEILADATSTLTPEALESSLREAIQAIEDARSRLTPSLNATPRIRTWATHRRAGGFGLDEWDDLRRKVFAGVSAAIRQARKTAEQPRAFSFATSSLPFDFADIPPVTRYLGPTVRDRLIDRREVNRRDLVVSETEVAFATQLEKGVVQPGGLLWGLAVLTFLTAVGLVLPVIVLAMEPVAPDSPSRFGVLYAFLVGVLALLLYLWGYAIRLQRQTSADRAERAGKHDVS